MRIPKYWSQATVREMDRNGKDIRFSCWRWSDQSTDDAHESAVVAARRILSSLLRREHLNRYDYGQVPLREEALEQFTDSQGGLSAALTRNSYGALILNAARVMFIDLDFPSVSAGEQLRYWFARLLRKSVHLPMQSEKRSLAEDWNNSSTKIPAGASESIGRSLACVPWRPTICLIRLPLPPTTFYGHSERTLCMCASARLRTASERG